MIEFLIKRLSAKGFKIASIKHATEPFDTPGKDSWRHLEAGSMELTCITPQELITIRRMKASLDDGVDSLHLDPDLILVEGFKKSDKPKILCAETIEEVEEALKRISKIIAITGKVAEDEEARKTISSIGPGVKVLGFEEILGLIEDLIVTDWLKKIPNLDCGKCRYGSCKALAEAIRRGEARLEDCVSLLEPMARLTLNDEIVPLSRWPQTLLRELILGFTRSLKLGDINLEKVKRIRVEIDLSR